MVKSIPPKMSYDEISYNALTEPAFQQNKNLWGSSGTWGETFKYHSNLTMYMYC